MHAPNDQPRSLHTAAGEVPLQAYRLQHAGRTWTILHTDAILTHADEAHFFRERMRHLPYGVALWPAAIALAHEVAARADAFNGTHVLELGAGTGLPGIVAASLGAHVVQTDQHAGALSVCRHNGAHNGVHTITYRVADWTDWQDTARYNWILGADILYAEQFHPHLRHIFETNLAPAGRVLLADPFRDVSFRLLEALQADGWTVAVHTWRIGETDAPRPIGIFELAPP